MKPTNTRKPLNPGDGAGLRCDFMAQCDPPACWERCETDSTVVLTEQQREAFRIWAAEHPRAIIRLYPGPAWGVTVCDTHERIIKECIG